MNTTTAERVAAEFGDDGAAVVGRDGAYLFNVIRNNGGVISREASTDGFQVFVFGDESAISTLMGHWDVRAAGCQRHCWEGDGCRCDEGEP